jgi:uncharacterized OB-fold protein
MLIIWSKTMSDVGLLEGNWEDDGIEKNKCDKCGDSMFPSQTYCTGVDRQLCKECYQIEEEQEEADDS